MHLYNSDEGQGNRNYLSILFKQLQIIGSSTMQLHALSAYVPLPSPIIQHVQTQLEIDKVTHAIAIYFFYVCMAWHGSKSIV